MVDLDGSIPSGQSWYSSVISTTGDGFSEGVNSTSVGDGILRLLAGKINIY